MVLVQPLSFGVRPSKVETLTLLSYFPLSEMFIIQCNLVFGGYLNHDTQCICTELCVSVCTYTHYLVFIFRAAGKKYQAGRGADTETQA